MPTQLPTGKQQYFDNAGVPLVGGKLYTYAAGTSVPRATYADAAGTIPNANPVVLDSRGEALVFWSGTYRVVLRDALDNIIWTVENVAESGLGSRTSSTGSVIVPAGTTAQRDLAPNTGYLRYNVDLGCYEGFYNSWISMLRSVNGVLIPDGGDFKLKTVNGNSLVGTTDIAVQATLVSGTNLKTVGGISLLGAGNIPLANGVTRIPRTANTQLISTNAGTLIDITANTFTQTFDPVANLGAGWWLYLLNSGTGDVTLDPSGAETIDGLTSFIMYPGEARLVQCDGTALRSIVLHPFARNFVASGNFTRPPGYKYYSGEVWGGGTSGGKLNAVDVAPGPGGACAPFMIPAVSPGTIDSVVVGAGGANVTVDGTNGNPGGTSSFAGTVFGYGGGTAFNGNPGSSLSGSAYITPNANPAAGPVSNMPGYLSGGWGFGVTANTVYGGAVGGAVSSGVTASPGQTLFGGAGGAASLAGNGTDGTAPGGGGGATRTGAQSGAGARGEVRIRGAI